MTRAIGVLIFPDFQLLDATGPIAVFDTAARECAAAPYPVRVMTDAPGPVISSSGVQLMAEHMSDDPLDTLIVAGGRGTREASVCLETLAFIRAVVARTRRIASVCTGAFILAAAGLLDGRRATTHWSRAAALARLYPQIHVEPDRIFIRDGAIWTSAGVTAGIDLALALVADDLGEAIAKRAAQQLVVYYRRPGGQSQFSALLQADRSGSRFSPVLGLGTRAIG
jgi:transcriptional regulator GlxA family with amidase domain